MEKLILKSSLPPGDIVMLTAAVRDLHTSYPNRFLTDVRTFYPDLWVNNPYLHSLADSDQEAKVIECQYSSIQKSNVLPYHIIHGFIQHLNQELDLNIKPSAFRGDIHLLAEEKLWMSQVREVVGIDLPFWIVVSGGKTDCTIKWWDPNRYQTIVDHFLGKICFVQVGHADHFHPPLSRVIDLRGKTDLRQLVRLMYHSEGVLCPVTFLMHLAAAVEVRDGASIHRPCVVIAGGREPPQWEAYPHHQFIHTNGSLLCCDQGGCWKSRTHPLGNSDLEDRPENLCVDTVGRLPRCMDMITPHHVIDRIELYFRGGVLNYLTPQQSTFVNSAQEFGQAVSWREEEMECTFYRSMAEEFVKLIPSLPDGFEGRGIVTCAGGVTYFTNAWICINILRYLGCNLPIELWYLGKDEFDAKMVELMAPLGVKCIDASEIRRRHSSRSLIGWESKPFSIIHSSFKEVLFLDADNVPVVDPTYLFDTGPYQETGAIFWPDFEEYVFLPRVWKAFGLEPKDEPQVESGQLLIDKSKCWEPLNLCMWYNEHYDHYYQYTYGDKDTFQLAWRKLNFEYAMPATRPFRAKRKAIYHYDFEGKKVFQHRNRDKWSLYQAPALIPQFDHESKCVELLKQLRSLWRNEK